MDGGEEISKNRRHEFACSHNQFSPFATEEAPVVGSPFFRNPLLGKEAYNKGLDYLWASAASKMAKLFTNHDPLHIHKILGFLVLVHYVYRLVKVGATGEMFTEESTTLNIRLVAMHALLSWSSLLLPLPKKRNFSSPMIWPEFRLHSITFGTRHVLATILSLSRFDCFSPYVLAITRCCLVLGTIQVASYITEYHGGSREKRTTNTMPYPAHIRPDQQKLVKTYYAACQFGATACCFLPDPTINFIPLLAIQTAPLMMTLLRKGKAKALTYHRVYTLSLEMSYIVIWIRMFSTAYYGDFTLCYVAMTWFSIHFRNLRTLGGLSPTVLWFLATIIAFAAVYPMYFVDSPHAIFEWAGWVKAMFRQHGTAALTVAGIGSLKVLRTHYQRTIVLFRSEPSVSASDTKASR